MWKAKADEVPAWVGPSTLGCDIDVPAVPTTTEAMKMERDDGEIRIDIDPRTGTRPPVPEQLPERNPERLPRATKKPTSTAPSHAPVAWCPCHGGDPFAKGERFSIRFNPMDANWRTRGCPKVVEREARTPSPPPSPPRVDASALEGATDAEGNPR